MASWCILGKDEQKARDNAGLTKFEPHEESFAERFVNAVLGPKDDKRMDEIFSEVFSDNGYTPSVDDAQHWAVEVLNNSGIEPMEPLADLYLIEEIFCQCFIPYDHGNISLDEAKSLGVKMAEEFFAGTEKELMFDRAPATAEWFALYIYRMCEGVDREIKDAASERKELDQLVENVDDHYFETTQEGRDVERRQPFVSLVNTGVKIGFLYREAWWKEKHEQAALNYYSQIEARKKGSPLGGVSTAKKYQKLKDDLLGYFPQAFKEKGAAFIGAPIKVVGATIREMALRDRPNDFVGPGGEPLSERWFIETFEDFQASGKLGPAIIKATQRA